VGFARSVELAMAERDSESARLSVLRDRFIRAAVGTIPDVRLNGPTGAARLPNNINLSVGGVDGSALLMNLDRAGICASSGSACSSGSIEPSHVLKAIGLPDALAASGIRFSLGRSTTADQIDQVVEALRQIVNRLRG
jgi:cysteine desulfurase